MKRTKIWSRRSSKIKALGTDTKLKSAAPEIWKFNLLLAVDSATTYYSQRCRARSICMARQNLDVICETSKTEHMWMNINGLITTVSILLFMKLRILEVFLPISFSPYFFYCTRLVVAPLTPPCPLNIIKLFLICTVSTNFLTLAGSSPCLYNLSLYSFSLSTCVCVCVCVVYVYMYMYSLRGLERFS